MEITDELLGKLGVDESFAIESRSDDDLGDLIEFIESASEEGVYADLGVNSAYLWIQTLDQDVVQKLTVMLASGVELGVRGEDIETFVDFELTGFEQARAILTEVRDYIASELAHFRKRFTPIN